MTRVHPSNHPAAAGRFRTTRWSLVRRAAARSVPGSVEAAGRLCQTYWGPIYAYCRRRGWSPQDAEDATQDFLVRLVVDGDRLARLTPPGVGGHGGRFRAFLLVCLRRHLANGHAHRSAAKRGGGRAVLRLETCDAERRLADDLADPAGPTPERAFDRSWALAILARALTTVAADYQVRGRGIWFDHVKEYLSADQSALPYAVVAERLGSTEGAVKVAVHRLRAAFRDRVEAELAATLPAGADLGEGIDDLFRAVSR